MRIGFIGAGKMGFTLGKYLVENNLTEISKELDYSVSGYYSQNIESAKTAAAFTDTNYYDKLEELINACDIIFITVPDGKISEVVQQLDEFGTIKGKIICHTSGALSSQVFSGMNNMIYGYSVHPIYAVSSKTESYKNFSECFITIEGNEEKLDIITMLFRQFGHNMEVIKCDDKVNYHSAAVFASNLVVGLYHMSVELLKECGFSLDKANCALKPLFINNAKNIYNCNELKDSLTGPVQRADVTTIRKHIDVLDDNSANVYKLLSNELLSIVNTEKNESYKEIQDILGGQK